MTMQVPDEVKQWKICGIDKTSRAPVSSWNNYTDNDGSGLFNKVNSKYLTWKKMKWNELLQGIHLNFVPETETTVLYKAHFRLPDGSERPIKSGESIALGIGGGEAFLYYDDRHAGINLKWSSTPHFQWRIWGDDPSGLITENSWVAIANDKAGPKTADYLIFHDRSGDKADVGWTSTPTGAGALIGSLKSLKG